MRNSVSDPLEPLILDLLEWVGTGTRPYDEVLDAWRTSCPRLPVWEEANARGLIDRVSTPGHAAQVAVSRLGLVHLRQRASKGDR